MDRIRIESNGSLLGTSVYLNAEYQVGVDRLEMLVDNTGIYIWVSEQLVALGDKELSLLIRGVLVSEEDALELRSIKKLRSRAEEE